MHVFCTLFDSHYFSRGLAAYQSLKKNCNNFHLYIFAFDDLSFKILQKMNLEYVTVISLHDFEDEKLLAIKSTRSIAEYCWTCTPSVIKYVLDNYKVDSCTYIDSDLYFFSDPSELFNEEKNCSVMITEHRFSENYKKYEINGIYNVQFMYFKNDLKGKNVVSWWRDRCIEWCFAKSEDGKFGDQKYLDDWTTRFKGVHVMQNTGGGVAPWNVQSYIYSLANDELFQTEKSSENQTKVVFYHFHNFKLYKQGLAKTIGYPLSKEIIEYAYKKYYKNLTEIENELRVQYPEISNKGFVSDTIDIFSIKEILSRMKKGNFSGENLLISDKKNLKTETDCIDFIRYILRIIKKILNKTKKL
ncbi:MAG: hypothetical protein A2355_06810, partial [Spirochaetes bacterium RIFOXYB1_FULL_32_8]